MVTQVELETLGKDELIRAAAALSHTARFGAKPRLDELQEPGNWGG
jgi:hypothetical protein